MIASFFGGRRQVVTGRKPGVTWAGVTRDRVAFCLFVATIAGCMLRLNYTDRYTGAKGNEHTTSVMLYIVRDKKKSRTFIGERFFSESVFKTSLASSCSSVVLTVLMHVYSLHGSAPIQYTVSLWRNF